MMKINGFNGTNTQTGAMGMAQANDSVSKNIQNQIANAQQKLQDLSSNEELSLEDKMKKRQEIQQEITNLNQQLRQHQIEQRKEQQSKKSSMDDMVAGTKNTSAKKGTGLSQAGMRATIDYSTGVYLKIEVSNGKEVLLHKAQQYNKETSEAIQTVKCPPYSATIKMEINDDDIISRFIMRRMPKEITLQKEGGDHYYISLNEENGNLHWVTDFNNIRIRTTIGQYKNIQPLIEEIHYTNEGRYNELATELIQKNMHESVIVFTDKDEKIGEWEFVNLMRNEENPFPLCKCTFQDGTELPFTLYMLLYLK